MNVRTIDFAKLQEQIEKETKKKKSFVFKDVTTVEDGLYEAVCVAMVKMRAPNFNDKTVMEDKYKLIFQLKDDNNEWKFVQTKLMKVSLYEKAPFFKLLSGWLKETDEGVLTNEIKNLVGKPACVMINNVPSTKDPLRSWVNVIAVSPSKKPIKPCSSEGVAESGEGTGQTIRIPKYFYSCQNAVEYILHEDFED